MTQTLLSLVAGFTTVLSGLDGSWVEHYQKAIEAHSQGRYQEAETRYRAALSRHRKTNGPANLVPVLLNNLGSECQILGRFNEAEVLYRQAIAEWSRVPVEESGVRATLTNLAGLYRTTARYAESEAAYKEALAEIERVSGVESLEYAGTLAKAADLQRALGNHEQALPMAERAVKIAVLHLNSGDPTLAVILQTLASVYLEMGRWDEAESAYERTRVTFVKSGKGSGVGVAAAVTGLGRVAALRGDGARAERFYRQAARIYEQTLGARHAMHGVALNNVAQSLKQQDRLDEAGPVFQRSLEILESAEGSPAMELVRCLGNYADYLLARELPGEAAVHLKRAIAAAESKVGADHREVALLQVRLAAVRHAQRSYVEAARLYRVALPTLAVSMAPADTRLVETAAGYGRLLREARGFVVMR